MAIANCPSIRILIEKESSKLLDVKPSDRLLEKELIKKIITPYIKHD
jgi:hypothetical protein